MQRADKLIHCGLFLVPWLPVFLLVMVAYVYCSSPHYVAATVLELHLPGETPVPAPHAFVPERITLPLVVLVCTLLAFVVGCALLLAGFFMRSARPISPSASV